MEGLQKVEDWFRYELTALKRELKDFHLEVIKLKKGQRSSQSEITTLRNELEERKGNEERMENEVKKLTEENDELKGRLLGLEERISHVERRDGGGAPSSQPSAQLSQGVGEEVLQLLNQLGDEIKSKFEEWNGRQLKLEKEIENGKQSTAPLKGAVSAGAGPSKNDPLFIPRDDDEDDDIQILSPPRCTTPASPSLLQPDDDVYSFQDDDDVDAPTPDAPPDVAVTGRESPVPGPSWKMNITTPKSRTSAPRRLLRTSPKWKLSHGKDVSDPSSCTCTCGTQFKRKSSLLDHIHYYTGEWKFSCEICQRPFAVCHSLRLHMKAVHNTDFEGGRFGCRNCGRILATRLEYRRHLNLCRKRMFTKMNVTTANNQVGNGGSDKTSSCRKNLDQPMTDAFMSPSTPPSTSHGTSRLSDSKKVTPIKIRLVNGKPVKKPNPSKLKTTIKMEMQDPNQIHGNDPTRDFACRCGMRFKDNKGIRAHLRYHTIQRFRCRHCGKWFAYACYRNSHILRAHKHQASYNPNCPNSQSLSQELF